MPNEDVEFSRALMGFLNMIGGIRAQEGWREAIWVKEEDKEQYDEWMISQNYNPEETKVEAAFHRLLSVDSQKELDKLRKIVG